METSLTEEEGGGPMGYFIDFDLESVENCIVLFNSGLGGGGFLCYILLFFITRFKFDFFFVIFTGLFSQ